MNNKLLTKGLTVQIIQRNLLNKEFIGKSNNYLSYISNKIFIYSQILPSLFISRHGSNSQRKKRKTMQIMSVKKRNRKAKKSK